MMKPSTEMFARPQNLIRTGALVITLAATLSGCATVVTRETPSIAHIHIGHAITGWRETPGKVGLLSTAEQASAKLNAYADLAADANTGMAARKTYVSKMGHLLDPEKWPGTESRGYGVRKATVDAMSHLQFAADSPDASSNVIASVAKTNIQAERILGYCDELRIFTEEALESNDSEEFNLLTEEIGSLARKISGQGDGVYGLSQLRGDIKAMTEREDPPYKTVDSWYLFNLIQISDGTWAFGSAARTGSRGGY